jgi:MFS family permease
MMQQRGRSAAPLLAGWAKTMTMTTTSSAPAPRAVGEATTATYTAFICSGVAFASWASRIPQIRDQLRLDPSTLGLMLLCVSAGCVVALPLAGPVVARFGSRRTVAAAAVLFGAGLATVAVGSVAHVAPVVVGLVVLGFATGAWDVAMNLQGTALERHLRRSIMSRFHAGFSVGTVAGALIGTAMVALRVPVAAHLATVAILIPIAVPISARRFIADQDERNRPTGPGTRRALAAWTEPRTLLIGIFVLAFTFAEGVGSDWISVAMIDGHHAAPYVGTLAFAAFLTAMTIGRWFGPKLLDRYGRVRVVRALMVTAAAGTVLFVFAPTTPLAFAGTLLWGLGIALGFPVGMSAAADHPELAAGRVSVVSSIGYCAFLAGPPTIGFLGEHVTVLRALTAVAVLLAVGALFSGVVAPPQARNDTPHHRSKEN